MKKTALGMDENVASMFCYLFGWITGLIFIFAEKENKNVRFHAWQSLLTFVGLNVLFFVLMLIPFIGLFLVPLLSLGSVALWVFLLVNAYQGKRIELPIVGEFAKKYSV